MASRPSWEGYLTFNLISIPVKAYNAMSSGGGKIGFHLLHAKCNHRIRYKKVCPVHGEVANDEIVSGYEHAKGEYVTVEKEEKTELKETDDKAIAIDTFVAPDAIDPIYFSDRTYYLLPSSKPAQRPYAVLMEAMKAHDRHAVAQVVFSGKGRVAVVRPFGPVLLMTLLNYQDQIKSPNAFEDEVGDPSVGAQERKLAEKLLESATSSEFELARYKDDYAVRLAKLIEAKTHKKTRKARPAETTEAGDLMEALRKSLTQERKRPQRRAPKPRRTTKASRLSNAV